MGQIQVPATPNGAMYSLDIFQKEMNDLLDDLDTVRVYIDDILHVTKGTWEDHTPQCSDIDRYTAITSSNT